MGGEAAKREGKYWQECSYTHNKDNKARKKLYITYYIVGTHKVIMLDLVARLLGKLRLGMACLFSPEI